MAGSTASKDELAARFTEALGRLNPSGGTIGLAVSGGPDSMAMLVLACEAIPGRFEVATVDHGLRPEAIDECALVKAACEKRGVPCEVLRVELEDGNVQARARQARYAALGEWAERRGLTAVATAHHMDDQAETLLMRLNRGSGVAGLAGVREKVSLPGGQVPLIRPLLRFRRAELEALTGDVSVAQDPSNADPRYDRVRMRKALADANWLDTPSVAQSASNLADAYEALETYADTLWLEMVRSSGDGFALFPGPAREMNRRLLARIMEHMGGKPRGGDVASLLRKLESGEGGNVAGILARVEGDHWILSPEPPRRTG
ncbi:tRNA lysidine(34) synthetase TilS [Aurantiacibacter poecillastricola]|uniref:tRNA lysidine(34) synthetase TilS n=1 Tax=Aurantiacibacter poecillastricola TaxID=3064385 RepID=UPI00273FCB0E|nr:tRNA lysidine(34) synthetase TilS [Aurantiacibacter sp. 219JJ12-13]MDP5261216.1 tRNA lysidine(34) synthetase TilS [Aurantiacibacter sp. 219JJ12-13]